jgi:hypothetical protein
MSFTFFQALAAGEVDDTLWSVHNDGTPVTIVVKATSGAVSADNPSWTMTGVLPEYTPLSGEMGAPSTIDATFENSSQSGIVRATS